MGYILEVYVLIKPPYYKRNANKLICLKAKLILQVVYQVRAIKAYINTIANKIHAIANIGV